MSHFVYQFGAGDADGRGDQKELLGGKGAGLAEMTGLGIPVPPGFTICTDICRTFHEKDGAFPEKLRAQVDGALQRMGELLGSEFGDSEKTLLVSVRSGAPVSMPGMMDTILNLGLNDETVLGLIDATGDARFAYDCYRRFVAMYGEIVLGVVADSDYEENPFARLLAAMKLDRGVEDDRDLSADDLKGLVTQYKIEILKRTEKPFPEDPQTQLWGAIEAVFRSWNRPRSIAYRRIHHIPNNIGTAVNIQAMVFGNAGEDSGTGVVFTRDPSSGKPGLFGEYLANAQGEDIVAGVRTPIPIGELSKKSPEIYGQLESVAERLEKHYGDMQDIEFTVQNGTLWFLQTRTGKRSGKAMIRIATDLVEEGILSMEQALVRMEPAKLDELMHPMINQDDADDPISKGLPASPGAASGRVVFSSESAQQWSQRGESVVLVRTDTSPEDISGMQAAVAILTARGGMTSHAAVVARGMGKPCVTACTKLTIEGATSSCTIGKTAFREGDWITIDGGKGTVFAGPQPLIPAELTTEFSTVMAWADQHRRLKIRANADTPTDTRTARSLGAEGIGLCRTEHMFFAPERIIAIRKMILADSEKQRKEALAELLPMQKKDFIEILKAMQGAPTTIRLLDPPLHEFLPHGEKECAELAEALAVQPIAIRRRTEELQETNPMLGHRGCRLAISFPEVYQMQVRAITEAALELREQEIETKVEIMIPFVSMAEELKEIRTLVEEEVALACGTEGPIAYKVGTMIELPRACLVANEVAEHADFFSFGTNDLTQTVFGLSRDDSGRFLPRYLDTDLLKVDPFVSIDRAGVGELIRIAVDKGREEKTKLKVGICGEHGGDPKSVEFAHSEGFDYVSCSPFRIPIAKLAAAKAAIGKQARK